MDKKILDASGNDVTHAGDNNWIPASRHNKMLGELSSALTLLQGVASALFTAKEFIKSMDKAGLINDEKGELKTFMAKSEALIKGTEDYLSRYEVKK